LSSETIGHVSEERICRKGDDMKTALEKVSKEKLLSPKELAERLSISRWTIYKMLEDGRIQSVKIGRLVRILDSEVLRIVEQGLRPVMGTE